MFQHGDPVILNPEIDFTQTHHYAGSWLNELRGLRRVARYLHSVAGTTRHIIDFPGAIYFAMNDGEIIHKDKNA